MTPQACPVCSGPLEIEAIGATTRRDAEAGFRRTLEGRWSCSDGCTLEDVAAAINALDPLEQYRPRPLREILERVEGPARRPGQDVTFSLPDELELLDYRPPTHTAKGLVVVVSAEEARRGHLEDLAALLDGIVGARPRPTPRPD